MLAAGSGSNQNNPSDDRDLVKRLAAAPAQQVLNIESATADNEAAKRIIKEFRDRLKKGDPKKPQ